MRTVSSAPFLLRKHRGISTVFAAILIVSGLSWWAGTHIQSPQRATAETEYPAGSLLARVEHRVLTRDLVFRGVVRPRREREIDPARAPGDGLSVVTDMSLHPGDQIEEGTRVAEISGRPVFALAGEIPMYRALHPGMEGEDVAQLQRALTRLGYGTGGTGGVFGPHTASAVRQFYGDRGYDAPKRLVTIAEEQSQPADGGGQAAVKASPSGRPVDDRDRTTRQVIVPYSEIVYLPALPARVTTVSAAVGEEPHGTLMKVATGGLLVHAVLPAADADVIVRGADVTVVPHRGGQRFSGTVTRVSPKSGARAQDRTTSSTGGRRVIRIDGDKPIKPPLRGRNVAVTMTLASTGAKVPVVPISAVWSGADGRSYVSVRDTSPGGVRKVAVGVGLTADGYAALTGVTGRLHAGDRVVLGIGTRDGSR